MGELTTKSILLFEQDAGRAVAFRLACERIGGKIFDFANTQGLDYFIKDLSPDYLMVNAGQFEQEVPLLLAVSRSVDIKVILYGEKQTCPTQLMDEWKNQIDVHFEAFPINPLNFFKTLLKSGA